jgi:hypothetical protein
MIKGPKYDVLFACFTDLLPVHVFKPAPSVVLLIFPADILSDLSITY